MEARKATAVDTLNATMLLICMESKRFEQYKHQVHKTLMPLTPCGMDLMEEAFKGVESIDYSYVLADMESFYQCNNSKIVKNAFVYTVTIPKMPKHGSHFGTCTCGVPKRDGIPCEHMVMMANAGVIQKEWCTRLSIMPYWFSTAHWHLQFHQTVVCRDDINIPIVKGKYDPHNDVCYCPSWSGANKSRRPSKSDGKRKPGVMDAIKKAGRKKRKKRMFCDLCQKFNHVTKDCYKNNPTLPALPNLPVQALEENNDLVGADGDMEANDGQIGQV
jgi:hypothetical protein